MEEIEYLEKQVIASLIFAEETHSYIKQISDDFFTNVRCRSIFKAIKQLYAEKQKIDIITINNKFSSGVNDKGIAVIEYISNLTDIVVCASDIETPLNKLKDIHLRNKMLNIITKYSAEIKDPLSDIDYIKNEFLKEVEEIKSDKNTSYGENMQDILINTLESIENKSKKGEDLSYYTGFFKLDALMDGLHENELTCVGARPGTGKTAFALQIAKNIASKGRNVYYNCLEMSSEQLMHRILASNCRINSQFLRNGRLHEEEYTKIGEQVGKINDLKLKIDTNTKLIEDLEKIAYILKEKNELDVLIIDYLTLLKTKQKFASRELEVADISRRLKLLALDLHIPIIILVQLNRDAENKVPTMANIRESGSIEQNCDNIIFLYNPNNNNDSTQIIDVILEKQRQGATGSIKLKFNKVYSEFTNPTY